MAVTESPSSTSMPFSRMPRSSALPPVSSRSCGITWSAISTTVYLSGAVLMSALTVSRLMKPAPITKQFLAFAICSSSLRVSARVQW